MNDRYLFRAKRIDNGEWLEWNVIQPDKESAVYLVDTSIDSSTICQCTGLNDMNGKLIWENDIVFVTDDDGNSGQVDTGVGEVDFLEGLWYISGNVQNALYDINKIYQIKVVGNIFDNPELPEQEG